MKEITKYLNKLDITLLEKGELALYGLKKSEDLMHGLRLGTTVPYAKIYTYCWYLENNQLCGKIVQVGDLHPHPVWKSSRISGPHFTSFRGETESDLICEIKKMENTMLNFGCTHVKWLTYNTQPQNYEFNETSWLELDLGIAGVK